MSARSLTPIVALGLLLGAGAPLAAQLTAAVGPQAGSTTLTFNDLTAGDVVTNQYPGVTVSGGLCANSDYSETYFGGDPMQATNFLNFLETSCDGSLGQPLTFSFATDINSFGFFGLTQGGAIDFTEGNGSITRPDPYDGSAEYVGFTDSTPFSSVTVSVEGDGYIALDNVSYTGAVSATPEPGSLVLIGTGLVGLFGVVRRRRGVD